MVHGPNVLKMNGILREGQNKNLTY